MTQEEARLIMSGWLERQSPIAFVGSLFGFRVALRCQVSALTDSAVLLSTAEGGSLAVDLSVEEMEFRYSEPREFPEMETSSGLPAAQKIASSVTVLFPLRVPLDGPDDVDREAEALSFIELIK